MKTKGIHLLLLLFLFTFCKKQKIQKAEIVQTRNTIAGLAQSIAPQRLGLGKLKDSLRFNIETFDAAAQLPEGEFVFSFQFNQKEIYKNDFEKIDLGGFFIWITPSGKDEIKMFIDGTLQKDGNYPLTFLVYKKGDMQILYRESLTLAIERSIIRTPADLQAIGMDANTLKGNYSLGNDIELTADFTPIASCSFEIKTGEAAVSLGNLADSIHYKDCIPFSGTLNGKNYTIKNLVISDRSGAFSGVGIFGVMDGKNAQVKNISIEVKLVEGQNLVGALAGFVRTDAIFSHIEVYSHPQRTYNDPNIRGEHGYIGGVFGLFQPYSKSNPIVLLKNIRSNVNVTGQNLVGGIAGALLASGEYLYSASIIDQKNKRPFFKIQGGIKNIGGITGYLYNAVLSSCNSGNDVLGSINTAKNIGGLVGTMEGIHAKITDSYHFHATNITFSTAQMNNDYGAKIENRQISGAANVGGIVGNLQNVSKAALLKVYVDSHQLGGANAHIFCPDQDKGYVVRSVYNEKFQFKPFNAAFQITQRAKDLSTKKDFEHLGFIFGQPWKWVENKVYGFPYF